MSAWRVVGDPGALEFGSLGSSSSDDQVCGFALRRESTVIRPLGAAETVGVQPHDLRLHVTGFATAGGVAAYSDEWVPLRISWAAGGTSTPLYLVVRDPAGGLVEFKVDPDSGALVGFVAVHLPALEDQTPKPLEDGFEGTVCLDLQMWPWTETPDYREPTVGRIDREARLSASADSGRLTLWFGEGEAATRVWAGDVELVVSSTSQLVAVSAPLSPGVALDGFLT